MTRQMGHQTWINSRIIIKRCMGRKVKIGLKKVYYNEFIYSFYHSPISWSLVIKVIFLSLYTKNIPSENLPKDSCSHISSDFY